MSDHASDLTITARGPAAEGRLPLAEVARLCGEFQATLERIALNLFGVTSITGRRPKDVVDAVRVEFTGFAAGSAVLQLELPSAVNNSLLDDTLSVLADGSGAIRSGGPMPEAFTQPVLDGLLRFTGGLGETGLTQIEVQGAGRGQLLLADPHFRGRLRDVRHQVERAETTIVGLLQMGDFAPSALRCRIDTVSASVACTFDDSLAETVLACLNTLVVASGTGEFAIGGALRTLDLSQLETVAQTQPASSLDELADEQGVSPWVDESVEVQAGFGASDLSDDEFAAFLTGSVSARGAAG